MQYARVATRLTLCACSMSAWHLSQLASEDAPLRLPQSPRRPLPPTLPLTSAEVASALRAALLTAGGSGPDVHGQVCTAPAELEGYAASQYSYHAGPAPDVIVFPRNTAEVAAVVRACAEQRFNLVPRAGGTSLEGQVVPVAAPPATLGRGRATIVLDMQRMDRVLEVNPRDMDIRVQAGVGWVGLANVLKPLGLMFPVDPGPGAQVRQGQSAEHLGFCLVVVTFLPFPLLLIITPHAHPPNPRTPHPPMGEKDWWHVRDGLLGHARGAARRNEGKCALPHCSGSGWLGLQDWHSRAQVRGWP